MWGSEVSSNLRVCGEKGVSASAVIVTKPQKEQLLLKVTGARLFKHSGAGVSRRLESRF